MITVMNTLMECCALDSQNKTPKRIVFVLFNLLQLTKERANLALNSPPEWPLNYLRYADICFLYTQILARGDIHVLSFFRTFSTRFCFAQS